MAETQADFNRKTAEARLQRNMVTLKGMHVSWWAATPRLSDESMKTVRDRRAR